MAEERPTQRKPTVASLWRLTLAIIGIIAVVQELRRPAEQRTWHGKVAGFVPYDFRKPTLDRFREAYWNPAGSLVSNKAWGVGWVLNLGAVRQRLAR